MTHWLTQPDCLLLTFTIGIFLIYVELNRPGRILPGAFGLLLVLVSVARITTLQLRSDAFLLLLPAILLLMFELIYPIPTLVAVSAVIALAAGLYLLLQNSPPSPITAVVCGFVLGAGTSVLTRIARRARANKAVN
jgi:membrane-bound serine protease (ClpP class)